MTEREILIEAMKTRGFTQQMLADAIGVRRQSNISEFLRSKSMRTINFVKLLDALDFDVIVKDRNSRKNENVWKVDKQNDTV